MKTTPDTDRLFVLLQLAKAGRDGATVSQIRKTEYIYTSLTNVTWTEQGVLSTLNKILNDLHDRGLCWRRMDIDPFVPVHLLWKINTKGLAYYLMRKNETAISQSTSRL